MKIKFILVIDGVCFSYPLIILRFYLHAPTEQSEELTNAADYHAIQVDASQVNFDSLVALDLTFDALHENGDLRLQQEDSLVVVNQINSLSQQDNSDDNDHNRLVLYRKPLARMNLINQETSHILIVVPQHTDYRISCLEDFKNMIHKILDVDGFSIEPTSELVQIMEANYEIFKMNLSARALYTFDFLNLKISPISRVSLLENKIKIPRVPSLGIRQRRGSKLRSQQLKEMIDAMENNDVVRDNYKERLLEYHKYL
ncbi:hypothetical protein MtrunA17_Chr5g0431941 [Medicago truncatula]|uniref:Uncharacterized protein n=1 Tax=Medicago truncatula TaxID=3880 RepID=A0A396HTK8_MEDTR|nr:uncharacterized protein LOC11412187 [Medicago truncatula]RHN56669.1 hypothetical protein MtrunA17_Chr5g0431941 [Medicago truncatula]